MHMFSFALKLAGTIREPTFSPFKHGLESAFGVGEIYVVLIIDDGTPTRHTYGLGPIRIPLILATQPHIRCCRYF